jgi:hypothetical protein
VKEIRYRDGAWPGDVRCILKDGSSFAVPKFFFNHLISSYVIERCLLCVDLASEGADLSVADAWGVDSTREGGFSLVVSRSDRGEAVVSRAMESGVLEGRCVELPSALRMHAHGFDLKKTGAWLRIRRRERRSQPVPRYDLPPGPCGRGRRLAEFFFRLQFALGRTSWCRWLVDRIPFSWIGRLYQVARVVWRRAAARRLPAGGGKR